MSLRKRVNCTAKGEGGLTFYMFENLFFNAISTTSGTNSEIFPLYLATSFTILELKNEY